MITILHIISHSYHFFVMGEPKIYFYKFLAFSTILLVIVIMLYIRTLDLFILHNCSVVPFGQHLPTSAASSLMATTLLSASTYSAF